MIDEVNRPRKLKVAVDGQTVAPGPATGLGSFTRNALKALEIVAPGELDLRVETPPGGAGFTRTHQRVLWEQIGLRSRMRGADVLFSPSLGIPWNTSRPVVATIHDLYLVKNAARLAPVSRWYWTDYIPATIRRASRVICGSKAVAEEIAALLGIERDLIKVIPYGMDFEGLKVAAGAIPAGLKLTSGAYVLFVGSLERRKNAANLVRAFAALKEDQSAVKLVLAGQDAGEAGSLKELAVTEGIGDRVVFTGYLDRSELVALMRDAACLALVSFEEGFGLPLIEAMALDTPVVTSNCSSMPETVGGAGLTADPHNPAAIAEALSRVLLDDELRERLVSLGREHIQSYTLQKMGSALAAVLREAAGR